MGLPTVSLYRHEDGEPRFLGIPVAMQRYYEAEEERATMISGTALLSPDGVYRYRLERHFAPFNQGIVCFIMLNPSTADAEVDDPTIRRCMTYTQDWGYTRLIVVNLFALRATDPKQLRKAINPFGPENGREIHRAAEVADLVVCAWGAHGSYLNAGRNTVMGLRHRGVEMKALGLTKGGEPIHPLYQRRDLRAEVTL